jgi:phytoene/squalene synthetase
VPDQAPLPATQLGVHGFGPGASFEGELVAVDLTGGAAGGMVTSLLGFRLDAAQRRRATKTALAGGLGETLRDLARTLEPGAALAAVLVEHVWARALEDAVSRTGGTPVANAFVEATTLSELTAELLAAATLFARSGR